MDAGPVMVSGPSGHAVSQWLRLPIRRLRTGDTLQTFANGRVAQHPVDPLEIDHRLVFRESETAGRLSHLQSVGPFYGPSGSGRTYASEPQLRVRDFCVSLSDLSELRRALNFPSRACNL